MLRTRTQNEAEHGGLPCDGEPYEYSDCFIIPCDPITTDDLTSTDDSTSTDSTTDDPTTSTDNSDTDSTSSTDTTDDSTSTDSTSTDDATSTDDEPSSTDDSGTSTDSTTDDPTTSTGNPDTDSSTTSSDCWGAWSSWHCDSYCTGGFSSRHRVMNSPSCPGPQSETNDCPFIDCIIIVILLLKLF